VIEEIRLSHTGTVPFITGDIVKIALDNNTLQAFHSDYHKGALLNLQVVTIEANNFTTLHDSVEPFMITYGYPNISYVSARANQIAGEFQAGASHVVFNLLLSTLFCCPFVFFLFY
jgi:hypothetical protein